MKVKNMEKHHLDTLDWKIIDALRRDGRISNQDLAQHIGLSASQCMRRVRQLELAGIIQGYSAVIDDSKLGFDMMAWVVLTIRKNSVGSRNRVMQWLQAHPALIVGHGITGDVDFLIKIRARNMAEFTRLLVEDLNGHADILSTQSYICLDTITPLRDNPQPAVNRTSTSA